MKKICVIMPITGVNSLHRHSPANFILHTLHWKENSAILFFLEGPGSVCGAWSVEHRNFVTTAALSSLGSGLGLHSSGVAAFGVPGVCQLKEPSKDSRNNSDFYANAKQAENAACFLNLQCANMSCKDFIYQHIQAALTEHCHCATLLPSSH